VSAVFREEPSTLPDGSYWATMGEISEVVGGGTPRTTDPTNFEGGDVPWITPADLSGYTEKYISHGARFITRKGLESSSARLLPTGTVLFTSRAPIGYVAIARNPVATNQGFKSFVLKDGVLPEYVYWWLRGSKQRAEALASGTTFLELSGANAKKLPIPIAPIQEQRRIVAELEKQFSRLDEAVANLKRVKANAKRLASAILVEAVAGRLVPSMRASWRTVQVCEAGDVVLGRQRAPQYLTGRWSRKYLRVANIKDDTVDYSDVETMDFDEAHFAKYQLTPGDILVSEGQSPELLGQSAVFRGFTEPLCFQKTLHRFRAHPGTTTPEFAQIVFRSHVRSGVFRRLGSITTNIGHLTLEKFKAAPFPLPPLDEQHRIVAEVDRRLSIVREVDAEVGANLRRAQALRQAVLVQAFSGEALNTEMTPRSRATALANAA